MSSSDTGNAFEGFKLWYYTPSIAAGAIFSVIFFILTGLHAYRLVKTRTWICVPFAVGALFEAIGYAARAAASNNMKSITTFIIQSILILVAPALFAASVYMFLGRIIRATRAESYSVVRVNWLTKIFVCGDVLCFLVQSAGGGLTAMAKTKADVRRAENIILAGLIIQILVFGVFVVVAGILHTRLRRRPTAASQRSDLPWQRLMLMLYAVSFMISLRNIFRVIEYAMGNTGYLLTHEWTLYVFDGVLMAITLGICSTWYITGLRPVQVQDEQETQHLEQQSYRPKQSFV